jgi:hypothetical protein
VDHGRNYFHCLTITRRRGKSANGCRQARSRDSTHRDRSRTGDRPAQCRDHNRIDRNVTGMSSVVVRLDGDAMTTTNDSANLREDHGCARLKPR